MLTTVFNFTTLWLYIIPNCTRLLFIARKVSISTCLGERLALFWEQMFPAAEKIHSDGVEVAGMHRKDGETPLIFTPPFERIILFRECGLSKVQPNFTYHSLDLSVLLRFSILIFTKTVCVRLKEGFQSTLSTWTIGPLQFCILCPSRFCFFDSKHFNTPLQSDAIFRSQKLQLSVSGVQGSCKNNWIFFVCWDSANTPPSLCYPFFCTGNDRFGVSCPLPTCSVWTQSGHLLAEVCM